MLHGRLRFPGEGFRGDEPELVLLGQQPREQVAFRPRAVRPWRGLRPAACSCPDRGTRLTVSGRQAPAGQRAGPGPAARTYCGSRPVYQSRDRPALARRARDTGLGSASAAGPGPGRGPGNGSGPWGGSLRRSSCSPRSARGPAGAAPASEDRHCGCPCSYFVSLTPTARPSAPRPVRRVSAVLRWLTVGRGRPGLAAAFPDPRGARAARVRPKEGSSGIRRGRTCLVTHTSPARSDSAAMSSGASWNRRDPPVCAKAPAVTSSNRTSTWARVVCWVLYLT